jgi:hypothetical protein
MLVFVFVSVLGVPGRDAVTMAMPGRPVVVVFFHVDHLLFRRVFVIARGNRRTHRGTHRATKYRPFATADLGTNSRAYATTDGATENCVGIYGKNACAGE